MSGIMETSPSGACDMARCGSMYGNPVTCARVSDHAPVVARVLLEVGALGPFRERIDAQGANLDGVLAHD